MELNIVNSPTVTSCTCPINDGGSHSPFPTSTLHRAVDSAMADEAPTKAIASIAATATRPSVLIDFIFPPLPAFPLRSVSCLAVSQACASYDALKRRMQSSHLG